MKMIVLDIDGTLFSSNKEITPRTLEALHKAQEKGIALVLASGRDVRGLKEIAQTLKMDQYPDSVIIGINGQQRYHYYNNELIEKDSISLHETQHILQAANQLNIETLVYSEGIRYNFRNRMIKIKRTLKSIKSLEFRPKGYEGFMKDLVIFSKPKLELNTSINKICFITPESQLQKIIMNLDDKLEKDYHYMYLGGEWVEMMPKGINKGTTLKEVIEHANLDLKDVFVFGDSANDIEMLELVPNSYAMKNGQKQAIKAATYTTKSNDEDGIAHIVERYL